MPSDFPMVCHDGTPKDRGFAITPSDSVDLSPIPCYLYVGTAGTMQVIPAANASATPLDLGTVSGFLPIKVRRVMLTGTSATKISGWY
jgi:hypothetical protein